MPLLESKLLSLLLSPISTGPISTGLRHGYPWRNGSAPAPDTQGPGFDSWRVSIFSIISLLPFFCAALAKRWKVQFRQG